MKTNSLYIFKDIFKNKKPFEAFQEYTHAMEEFFNNSEGFYNGFTVHPSYLKKVSSMDVATLIDNVNNYKMTDLLGILSLAQLTNVYANAKKPETPLKNIFMTHSDLFSEEFLLNKKEWDIYSAVLSSQYKEHVNLDHLAKVLPMYLKKFPKELKKQLLKDKQYEILLYLHTMHHDDVSLSPEEFIMGIKHVLKNMSDRKKSDYLMFERGNWYGTSYERLLMAVFNTDNLTYLLLSPQKSDFLQVCVENENIIRKLDKNELAKTLNAWIRFVGSNFSLKYAVNHPLYIDIMNEKYKTLTEKDYLNILLNAIEDIVINKKTGAIDYSGFSNQLLLFKNIVSNHPQYKKILLARAVCHDNLRYRVLWFLTHNEQDIPAHFTTKVTSDFLKSHWESFNTGIQYKDITHMRNTLNFLDVGVKWEVIEPHIMQLLNNQGCIHEAPLYL